MLFTRTELELLTVPQLKNLCHRYGLSPTGSAAYKDNFITSLMAFPLLALQQMEEGRGLKIPSFEMFQHFGTALDRMNTPTDEQKALIKASMEGRRMPVPQRWEQEKLLSRYHAKNHLEQVITLLGMQ